MMLYLAAAYDEFIAVRADADAYLLISI